MSKRILAVTLAVALSGIEELPALGEDCFYFLAGDVMLVTSGRELTGTSDITYRMHT